MNLNSAEILLIMAVVNAVLVIPFIIISIYNLKTAPVLSAGGALSSAVSILIPARNEEKNISDLLHNLTSLKDVITEIIVLDDNSADNTYAAASGFAQKYPYIRVLYGAPLPDGWLGKNFACHQLAQAAESEYFLFLDADVRIQSGAVSGMIREMASEDISFASVFPTQKMNSFGEKLLVPMMNWLLLTFLPLRFVYTKNNPAFAAANGQMLCIHRQAYNTLGGHEAVRKNPVEDMALIRKAKKSGLRCKTYTGGEMVSCTMYDSLPSAINGFSKNFYPGFEINAFLFLFLLLFMFFVFLVPFITLYFSVWFTLPVLLIVFQRMVISRISHQPVVFNSLFHPAQTAIMLFTGIRSVILSKRRKISWKGRTL